MKIRDWMSPDPITVTPDTSVQEARQLLNQRGIRHLPVVRNDKLVGIISDRDVRVDDAELAALANIDELGELLGGVLQVDAVMSTSVHTVGPDEPVENAARLMLSRRISALPVVDPDEGLVGLITTTDCLLASLAPISEA